MSEKELRESALRLFRKVRDNAFQYALENGCYEEIIKLAPREVYDILWGLSEIPEEWAHNLLLAGFLRSKGE